MSGGQPNMPVRVERSGVPPSHGDRIPTQISDVIDIENQWIISEREMLYQSGVIPARDIFRYDAAARWFDLNAFAAGRIGKAVNNCGKLFQPGSSPTTVYYKIRRPFTLWAVREFGSVRAVLEKTMYLKSFVYMLIQSQNHLLSGLDYGSVFYRVNPKMRQNVAGELSRTVGLDGTAGTLLLRALDQSSHDINCPTDCGDRRILFGDVDGYNGDAVVLSHTLAHYGDDHVHLFDADQWFDIIRPGTSRVHNEKWHPVHLHVIVHWLNLLRKGGQTLAAMRRRLIDENIRGGYMSREVLLRGVVDPERYAGMIRDVEQRDFYLRLCRGMAYVQRFAYINQSVIDLMASYGTSISDVNIWSHITEISYLLIIGSPGCWKTTDEFPYRIIDGRPAGEVLPRGLRSVMSSISQISSEASALASNMDVTYFPKEDLSRAVGFSLADYVTNEDVSAHITDEVSSNINVVVRMIESLKLQNYVGEIMKRCSKC